MAAANDQRIARLRRRRLRRLAVPGHGRLVGRDPAANLAAVRSTPATSIDIGENRQSSNHLSQAPCSRRSPSIHDING